jgi:hypothetical protein
LDGGCGYPIITIPNFAFKEVSFSKERTKGEREEERGKRINYSWHSKYTDD